MSGSRSVARQSVLTPQFIDEVDIELVNQELHFSSPDNSIVINGGCDLFTTKPIGLDRKLFKTIDKHVDQILADNLYLRLVEREQKRSSSNGPSASSWERKGSWQSPVSDYPSVSSSHERGRSGLGLSSSPPPPDMADTTCLSVDTFTLNDSVDELPFGPLKNVTTRKTFAYLIAILNSTYPDHDFSTLQPSIENFHRIPRADIFIKRFNNLLTSLGKKQDTLNWIWDTINLYMDMVPARAANNNNQTTPNSSTNHTNNTSMSRRGSTSLQVLAGGFSLEPGLEQCQIYQFQPSDESILQDLGYPYQPMWSYYWFIYNKKRKRVSFVYLRAINKLHYAIVNSSRPRDRHGSTGSTGDAGKDMSDVDDDDDQGFDYENENSGRAGLVRMDSDGFISTDVVGDLEM